MPAFSTRLFLFPQISKPQLKTLGTSCGTGPPVHWGPGGRPSPGDISLHASEGLERNTRYFRGILKRNQHLTKITRVTSVANSGDDGSLEDMVAWVSVPTIGRFTWRRENH